MCICMHQTKKPDKTIVISVLFVNINITIIMIMINTLVADPYKID